MVIIFYPFIFSRNIDTINFVNINRVDSYVPETVMKTAGATVTGIQGIIREWLRHAGDGVRYRQKKENQNAQISS